MIEIVFSLPLSENSNAIDYVIPDYNEVKQGYVQPPSTMSVDSSKKNLTKQQQQVNKRF